MKPLLQEPFPSEAARTPPRSAHAGMRLRIERLQKRYATIHALRGVDLEVSPGAFIAIVGRSGCGKSTLLRLIAGLEPPTAGEVRLDESPASERSGDVRVMFQDARLLPWRCVLDNVALGLKRQERARAEWALEQVGLQDRAKDFPAVLSGGQKQRVALARALVSQPRLLLLDEPLGALDALTRLEMQQLIERLWVAQGFTALLVTHDVSEAVALADRILVLEEGEVALELQVELSRPRRRSDERFGRIEEEVLNRILEPPTAFREGWER